MNTFPGRSTMRTRVRNHVWVRRGPYGLKVSFPKRLRHRLYTISAALSRGGRQMRLRYASHQPWAALLAKALTSLTALDST